MSLRRRSPCGAAVLVLLACSCGTSDSSGSRDDLDAQAMHDPVSMPETPTLSADDFHSASVCAGCHPNHAAQWQLSRHARSMRDPVFRALVARREAQREAELEQPDRQFCTQCHSTICTRGGECGPELEFDSLSPLALEGVTCEGCHKIEAVVRPSNAGHLLDPTGPMRGPIVDPVDGGFHAAEYSPLFDDAVLCGSCHDVVERSGLIVEQPYAEWLGSPANPEQPCQSCHMPSYAGHAAVTGPARDVVHRHDFLGVDLPLEGDVDAATMAELDARIDALLAGAASLELELPNAALAPGEALELRLTLENRIAGHAFPTGSTFLRQVWVALTVRDGDGVTLYATGQLDAAGDLGDHWNPLAPASDPDLMVMHSGFVDAEGDPALFSWDAAEHRSHALAPGASASHALRVPIPAGVSGPLRVDATLHFRSYPPFLLRELGLAELIPLAPVRDVATASGVIELAAAEPAEADAADEDLEGEAGEAGDDDDQ